MMCTLSSAAFLFAAVAAMVHAPACVAPPREQEPRIDEPAYELLAAFQFNASMGFAGLTRKIRHTRYSPEARGWLPDRDMQLESSITDAAFLEELEKTVVPTPFQERWPFYYAQQQLAEIFEVERALSRTIPTVFIGTIQSSQINAESYKAYPGDGHLIVLNTAVLEMARTMANLTALTLPTDELMNADLGNLLTGPLSPHAARKRLYSNPELTQGFFSAILEFARPTGKIAVINGDEARVEYWQVLTAGAHAFCVAHEYAHISLNHLDELAASAGVHSGDADSAGAWKRECDADLRAFEIIRCIAHQWFPDEKEAILREVYVCGGEFFLTCLDLLEQCRTLLQSGCMAEQSPAEQSALEEIIELWDMRKWLTDLPGRNVWPLHHTHPPPSVRRALLKWHRFAAPSASDGEWMGRALGDALIRNAYILQSEVVHPLEHAYLERFSALRGEDLNP